jgi:hypothetical protein
MRAPPKTVLGSIWVAGAVAASVLASAAQANPLAVLNVGPDGLSVVDLGSLHKTGELVRYEKIVFLIPMPPVEMLPDEMHYGQEADCKGARTRMLKRQDLKDGKPAEIQLFAKPDPELTDWTEVDPAELRMACAHDAGAGSLLPDVAAARAALKLRAHGKTDDLKPASARP